MNKRIEDACAGIAECWDYQRRYGEVRVREEVMNELEKAKRDGLGLAKLAQAMEKRLGEDYGWTIEDARLLKTAFSAYNIAFTVRI